MLNSYLTINQLPACHALNQSHACIDICDMIKGNESLVENVNFYFLTPLSHNFKILHFDANPIKYDWISGYIVMKCLAMLKTI